MRKSLPIFFIQLLISFSGYSQFFSGYYLSDPPMDEFEHLKVHHHHSKDHKYEGDLSVKGFSQSGELWDLPASMISGEKADYFISRFSDGKAIQTVYEFKISIDGIEEDFILLGYEGEDRHPAFIAIEEVFESEQEINLIELKTFKLVKAHHLDRR